MKLDFTAVKDAAVRLWPKRLGRLRTSTVVLIGVFIALSWVHQAYAPEPARTQTPGQQVVPPGFVPDPDYTWVPRTNVQTPRTTTPTTTPPTTTVPTTTSPTETTAPTSPEESTSPTGPTTPSPPAPRTTVIDPDGPGLLPPITLPVLPGAAPEPPADQSQPVPEPVAPAAAR
ncbi:hypothetical protein [Mycolicibacterium sp. XJ870]